MEVFDLTTLRLRVPAVRHGKHSKRGGHSAAGEEVFGVEALPLRPFFRCKPNDDHPDDENRQPNQRRDIDAVHVELPFLSRIPPTAAMALIP